MSGIYVMVRRQLRLNRNVLIVIATLITINNVIQVTSYQSIFPNPATRARVLETFTSNGALRALYGYPFNISSPTGWLAWRSLGFMVLVMAMWAAFITAGALRGEEESGRGELVLSQPQPRASWFAAALTAVTIETFIIAAVDAIGLAAFCVTRGLMSIADCLEIGLQLIVPALLFAAVAGVASQLIGTVRGARIAAAAVLALAFFLRTAADAGPGNSWLRWTTPLGWVEELHPPASPSPVALILSVAACAVLVFIALRMLAIRDIGVGLLPHSDTRNPRYFLLRNPWQAALRDDLPQLSMWLAGSLFYTLLLGSLAKTLLDLVASTSAFGKLLGHSFGLNAYIAASFSVVELIVTLFAVTLVVGARGEEASGRLELLTAGPLSRIGWLLGRAGLASGLALVLALLSAMALWVGAEVTGQSMSFGSLIEAAFNCIPLIVISVGAAVAILAITPRAVAFIYAPVAVFYLWDALGTAIKAPTWTLNISPFHALAEIPAQDFAILPALILTVIGLIFGALGLSVFRGRDLATG